LSLSITIILLSIVIISAPSALANNSLFGHNYIAESIFNQKLSADKRTSEEEVYVAKILPKNVGFYFENALLHYYDYTIGYLKGSFTKHNHIDKASNDVGSISPEETKANELLEEAIDLYDRALKIEPNNSVVLYNKGVGLIRLAKYQEAVETLTKSLETAPRDDPCLRSDILYNLSIILFKLEKSDNIYAGIDRILTLLPNATDALNIKGLHLYEQGNYEAAIETFNRALKTDPTNADVLNNKGNALLKLGKADEALKFYERARASEHNKSNKSNNDQCGPSGELHDLEPIISNMTSAISYSNKEHKILGPTYPQIEDNRKSFSPVLVDYSYNDHVLDISLENKASFKELMFLTNQGIALANISKNVEALKIYEAVLVIDPNFAPALFNMAEVQTKLGNITGALDNYRKAGNADPDYQGEVVGVTETRPSREPNESGILVLISKNIVEFVSN
jgi:tetratricopeptide (TPR) repeat protein